MVSVVMELHHTAVIAQGQGTKATSVRQMRTIVFLILAYTEHHAQVGLLLTHLETVI